MHPNGQVRAFDVRRRNPFEVRVPTDGSRNCCDDVRRWPEPVWAVRAWMRVLLDELRKVHIGAEVFLDRIDVAVEAVCRELAAVCLGDPAFQVADELVRVHGVAFPNVVAQHGLRLAVDADPHVLVAELNRIVKLEPLLFLLNIGSCLVSLHVTRAHVLDLGVEQPRAFVSDRREQRQDGCLVNARNARRCSNAHPFGQEREHLHDVVNACCVAAERPLAGFRERCAASAATVAGSSRFGESESFSGSVFAFRAGHNRPLALKGGGADNQDSQVWIARLQPRGLDGPGCR